MKPSEFIKTVFQRRPQECAAACTCMVMNYYGKHISLDDLCKEHHVAETYCSAGDIMRIAKAYGFTAHGHKTEPTQVDHIPTPAILHWNSNHFIVLESFDGEYFYVNDPNIGRIRLNSAAMVQNFTGVYLIFEH